MHWITGTLGSSIGKKLMMAITGFSFCGFLTAHLAGNLTIYGGQAAFNSYAAHLHSLGPLITVAERVAGLSGRQPCPTPGCFCWPSSFCT
jgi:succinate dehydrogenase / fumarate reductase cytochrome b subunit